MSDVKKRNVNFYEFDGAPEKPIVSEGDKLIKGLVEKQLNKNINLHEYDSELSRIQHFEKPTELVNETEFLSGHNGLVEFKKQTEYLQTLQELKSAGLDDDEVKLYLEYQKETLKHRNICSAILEDKLQNIFKKLKHKNDNINQERNFDTVSRHVKEIALNTKPNSLETQIFKFSTSCLSKNETNDLLDPINNLPTLEKKLFGHLNNPTVPSLKKRRKKAKKYLDNFHDEVISNINVPMNNLKSKWDVKDIPNNSNEVKSNNKIYTCVSQRKYTIVNKEIVEITSGKINKKTELENVNNGKSFVARLDTEQKYEKISEEDIRKLPKFHNYEQGTPSKVLYLKNLPKKFKQEDLVSLFSSFDNGNQRITYRILTGKMAGQAFVTFNSTQQATDALEKVNGTIIKTKPIIIQYGKMK